MKILRTCMAAAAAMLAASMFTACTYDDSGLWDSVNGLEQRVITIEKKLADMNTDVQNIKALVYAQQNRLTITTVTTAANGYVIHFSDGTSVSIRDGRDGKDGADGKDGKDGADGKDGINGTDGKDGKDGADGKDGKDGKDGSVPVMGVAELNGQYYWTVTINGQTEFLLDSHGNYIVAVGRDGKDGNDPTGGVAPIIKVDNYNYWVISYDGGVTFEYILDHWKQPIRYDDGSDSNPYGITNWYMDGDMYVFELSNGTVIRIRSCECTGGNPDGKPDDIPDPDPFKPIPNVPDPNIIIPNPMPGSQYEDEFLVGRIDITGIQHPETGEWITLYGSREPQQNLWLDIDGEQMGTKVTMVGERTAAVDLVFLVDNSGSMSEEADAIARDIISWSQKLASSGLDIRFACVGYDGEITGAINFTTPSGLSSYLNRSTGTRRTVGFEGSDASRLKGAASAYFVSSRAEECGMAALRYADSNMTFRSNANRVYVNFTDEENQSKGKQQFSVESLKTNWTARQGTIHTVYSGGKGNDKTTKDGERNGLMSDYTGGTIIETDGSFTGVSLDNLPVSGALQNSAIIRFGNVRKFIDGNDHTLTIVILTPDNAVRGRRTFTVRFEMPS